jgi:anti-anti-sigma regulatory factor
MKLSIQGLTIQDAAQAKELFIAWLNDVELDGSLDLSSVERIDMCGIQLLLSLKKSLAAQEMPLQLSGLSPFLIESLNLSGCSSLLEGSR